MPVDLLARLGIHPDVRNFFAPYHQHLVFPYGSESEHFGPDLHRVPITEGIWTAGEPELASDIFICGSAMDAIAFNRVSPSYAFIAVGALPIKQQFENIPERRFHLLFGNDDLGAVCDIKTASFIRRQPLSVRYIDHQYQVRFRNQSFAFDRPSLSALEKATGYRFRIRTHKPKNANTWTSSLNHRPSSPSSKPLRS